MMVTKKFSPSWSDVKAKLTEINRSGLLALVQDLYATSEDNQNFLHARFGVGDVLGPYKAASERWLWPDLSRNLDTSVAKAKKSIGDYKKAVGHPVGLAELVVFYCECAIGFANDVGLDDDSYYDALVRMFEHALKTVILLPQEQRNLFLDRLNKVRTFDRNISGWVAGELNEFWHHAGLDGDE